MRNRNNKPESVPQSGSISNLRQKAEKLLNTSAPLSKPITHQLSEADTLKLIHELQVHQFELELQNEELLIAQEKASRVATDKYAELFDFAPSGYFTLTREGEISDLNLMGSEMLGKLRSKLKHSRLGFFVSDDTKPAFNNFLDKVFSSKIKESCEVNLQTAGNVLSQVYLCGIAAANGEQCLVTAVDITKSNHSVLLQKEHDRLLKIAGLVPGVVYQFRLRPDGTSCFPFASDTIREVYRVSPDEVRDDASKVFAIIHPDDYSQVLVSIQESAKNLSLWQHEYRTKFEDGTVRSLYGNAVPQLEDDGSVLWHGFITDITDRLAIEKAVKQAEEKLRENNAKIDLAMQVANMAWWEMDIATGRVIFDKRKTDMLGYPHELFTHYKHFMDLVHPDDCEPAMNAMRKHLYGEFEKYEIEYRIRACTGEYKWFHDIGSVVKRDSQGMPVNLRGMVVDISERKQIEEALNQSEALLRAITDSANNARLDDSENRYLSIFHGSPDGIIIADPESKMIVFANPGFCKMFGYSESELKSMSIAALHPSGTFHLNLARFEKQTRGENNMAQSTQCIRKNGEIFYADISSGSLVLDGRKNNVGFFRDITERKQAEDEVKAALVRALAGDRLKTAFINNISHELRTPLNAIVGFSELLTDPDLTLPEREDFFTLINTATNRLINTVTNYMDISRIASANMEVYTKAFALDTMLLELYKQFKPLCKVKNIILHLIIPEKLPAFTFHSDSTRLQKALWNLLDNAVKFTVQGMISFGYIAIAGILEFFVTDTGCGISKENHTMIFGNFVQEEVSLNRRYEGSGLGLPITLGIVNLLGGTIRMESEPGIGSTFYFTIPSLSQSPASSPRTPSSPG